MDLGRLMMVSIHGRRLDSAQAKFLRDNRFGGVCLFGENLGTDTEIRTLTSDILTELGETVLIAIDQEGGAVTRLTSLSHPPSAMALGAVGSADDSFEVGLAVGDALKSFGINWNFAPVLDVNSNPANPIIAERAFSDDPDAVARMARAWIAGATHAGVASCAKHFPGHGDVDVDSHVALPVSRASASHLREVDLLPFALMGNDCPAIMTAHILFPAFDEKIPATMSSRIVKGMLRDEMGYDGVVITDSLAMDAVRQRYGYGATAVGALSAGVDMVLAVGDRPDQLAALSAMHVAAREGTLSKSTVLASHRRLYGLASRYPGKRSEQILDFAASYSNLMQRVWEKSLTAVGVPMTPRQGERIRVISQRPKVASFELGANDLREEQIAAIFADWDTDFVFVEDLTELDWTQLLTAGRRTVLVSHQRVRYGEEAIRWKPDLHIVLRNPYQALDVPAPALVSWGYAPAALRAVSCWLAGNLGAKPTVLKGLSHL